MEEWLTNNLFINNKLKLKLKLKSKINYTNVV